MTYSRSLVVAMSLIAGAASADTDPPPSGDRVDAKSLMQSGVRLLEAKDYLGALAVFKDAYRRFPSAKILLNIGTTENLLDRKADAANSYQTYLDSPDADPAKKTDVSAAVAELDKAVGQLELAVTPVDAEVQINNGTWQPAARAKLVRVTPGQFDVRVRKDKFQADGKTAAIGAGERTSITIALTALPEQSPQVIEAPRGTDLGIEGSAPKPRSRFAAIALAHIDIPRPGAAARVGVGMDVTGHLHVQAAALLGPANGAYAGATFGFLSGTYHPYVVAGMPIFFSDGARIGVRAGGGLEIELSRHVSLLAEVAIEVMLNPEDDILKAVMIPALGAAGRL